MSSVKTCKKCGATKSLTEFRAQSWSCKQCNRDDRKALYRKDPKRSYEYHLQWCKDHPEQIKELHRAIYRRTHPGSKSTAQIQAEKAAKAERTDKACKKCGVVKPIEEFGPVKHTADGRRYQCRECIADGDRLRYAASPKMLEYVKIWAREHRENGRQIAHRRRTRKRGLPGSHTLAQWRELCKKFGNCCVCCGKSGKLTRDHVIPISNPNSSNDITNLQPLCYSCNSAKGNRRITDYRSSPFGRGRAAIG